jgi:hypothetical protein
VSGTVVDDGGGPRLEHPPLVEEDDARRDMADHGEVVGDEEIAEAEAAGRSVMLFLHKPLVIDDGARENVTVAAAPRQRILGTFRYLRVVANGHVHRYRRTADGDVMAVWAPSLSFAPAAEPRLKFGPGTAGIVEYSIRGHRVDARFVAVPGIEGAADFSALPEVQESMAALSRKSA